MEGMWYRQRSTSDPRSFCDLPEQRDLNRCISWFFTVFWEPFKIIVKSATDSWEDENTGKHLTAISCNIKWSWLQYFSQKSTNTVSKFTSIQLFGATRSSLVTSGNEKSPSLPRFWWKTSWKFNSDGFRLPKFFPTKTGVTSMRHPAFPTTSLRPLMTVIFGPFTAATETSEPVTLAFSMAFFTSWAKKIRKNCSWEGKKNWFNLIHLTNVIMMTKLWFFLVFWINLMFFFLGGGFEIQERCIWSMVQRAKVPTQPALEQKVPPLYQPDHRVWKITNLEALEKKGKH